MNCPSIVHVLILHAIFLLLNSGKFHYCYLNVFISDGAFLLGAENGYILKEARSEDQNTLMQFAMASKINKLELIQKQDARLVCSNYDRFTTSIAVIGKLKWVLIADRTARTKVTTSRLPSSSS